MVNTLWFPLREGMRAGAFCSRENQGAGGESGGLRRKPKWGQTFVGAFVGAVVAAVLAAILGGALLLRVVLGRWLWPFESWAERKSLLGNARGRT
jgi:hypothetical protein